MTWTPPPRPRWAERLLAHAESAGGADRLVSLDRDELRRTAITSSGLDDFGDDGWLEPFGVFMDALARESDLHLAGRLLVRTELVRTLRNRLRLTDLWTRRPELLDDEVKEPVFIVGSPRSGTSILHELMACDRRARAPAMWEMQHPVEAVTEVGRHAQAGGEAAGDLAAVSDRVVQFSHDLQPEYETMHANSGYLPNECIFITMHEFLSDHWGGQHVVPSYDAYLARADHRPAYRFHKKLLQTLQSVGMGPDGRWLLKAPSHLPQLRALFDVYPDARIVRTHRDPLAVLPSALSLLGTLKWMRCNNVDMSLATRFIPAGFAATYEAEIADRTSSRVPDDRFVDVQFSELVADPVATVARVYERLDRELDDGAREAVAGYARSKPKGSRGAHVYSLEGMGLDRAQETERFRFYMDRYGIEREQH